MTTEKPDPAALLPCPWCGCKPDNLSVTEGSIVRWRLVECPECGAGPGEIRVQTMGEGTREAWEAKAHVDAATAWNIRAALQPQGPTTERVNLSNVPEICKYPLCECRPPNTCVKIEATADDAAVLDHYLQMIRDDDFDLAPDGEPEASRAAVLSRMSGVPEGWKMVPVEPTEAMLVEGAARVRDFLEKTGPYPRTKAMYAAMLAAAPSPEVK